MFGKNWKNLTTPYFDLISPPIELSGNVNM